MSGRRFVPLWVSVALLVPSVSRADDPPSLDPVRPIRCAIDDRGRSVQVQCDDVTRRCLVAPDGETNSQGAIVRPLERARSCAGGASDAARPSVLAAQGYKIEAAVADTPFGWARDARGRVFQVNFDLTRRLYLGASWAPARQGGQGEAGRTSFDFGVFVFEELSNQSRTRHRFRVVEGEVAVAPFSADLVLAHYDLSRRFVNPLLRLTTFFGKPRRHDATVNLGLWADAGHLEARSNEVADTRIWKLATTHATIDLWQSRDLESFVRLRGGLGIEQAHSTDLGERTSVTPGGAVEANLALDPRGFYHLGGLASYERPQNLGDSGGHLRRMRAQLGSEVIVVAINDQPLTLHFAAAAEKRDDIPGLPDRWALTANAGLRVSLWAPPRAR